MRSGQDSSALIIQLFLAVVLMELAGILVYLRKKRSAADIVRQRLQRLTLGRKPTTSEFAAGRRFKGMCSACGEWFYFAGGGRANTPRSPLSQCGGAGFRPEGRTREDQAFSRTVKRDTDLAF